MKITTEILKSKKACQDQVDLFIETFPEGTEVTEEACLKAASVGIDFEWASENLLNKDQLKAYEKAITPLWEVYEASTIPTWEAYEEAITPLWEAYEEAKAPLWEAYEETKAPLLKAYKEAKAPLLKAYKESIAIAFFTAFNN